ncbi:RHS repeat-associated core domain-containing protein [Phytobacter palmae]|nr:RHS repeat-associated core domain-containing protein [Phytobacter palmae]
MPLTYVYSDAESDEPLARIDGAEDPDIFWFHCQPNGTPERVTDRGGHIRWEGQNSVWGKLLHESIPQETGYAQNLGMQEQYLDRETGLHYNLFRYYDPDSARFTQQDPIGLRGGLNLCSYAPNPLSWIDPLGLKCSHSAKNPKEFHAAVNEKWGHKMTPAEMREIQKTIDNIKLNRPAYSRDGIQFENNFRISPDSQRLNTGSGPYREWTVRIPGVGNRGTRRIVVDTKTGQAYYSHDHYNSFIEIDLGG